MQHIIFLTVFIVTINFFSVSGQVVKEVECDAHIGEIRSLSREVMCKPRKTLVKMTVDNGRKLFPEFVAIDRCTGNCLNNGFACTAIGSTLEKVVVQGLLLDPLDFRCYEIEVEKHTSCKCACSLNGSECNSNQTFNAEQCECE